MYGHVLCEALVTMRGLGSVVYFGAAIWWTSEKHQPAVLLPVIFRLADDALYGK